MDRELDISEDRVRLVRPYARTDGRVAGSRKVTLDLATLVVTTEFEPATPRFVLTPDHQTILQTCRQPLSIADLASTLDWPLGVIRVLTSDLIEHGAIETCSPQSVPVDVAFLEKILNGLHSKL